MGWPHEMTPALTGLLIGLAGVALLVLRDILTRTGRE